MLCGANFDGEKAWVIRRQHVNCFLSFLQTVLRCRGFIMVLLRCPMSPRNHYRHSQCYFALPTVKERLLCFPVWKLFNSCPFRFLWRLRFVGIVDWNISHLWLNSIFSPSSLPGGGGWGHGWKFEPANHVVGSPERDLLWITKDTHFTFILWNGEQN